MKYFPDSENEHEFTVVNIKDLNLHKYLDIPELRVLCTELILSFFDSASVQPGHTDVSGNLWQSQWMWCIACPVSFLRATQLADHVSKPYILVFLFLIFIFFHFINWCRYFIRFGGHSFKSLEPLYSNPLKYEDFRKCLSYKILAYLLLFLQKYSDYQKKNGYILSP